MNKKQIFGTVASVIMLAGAALAMAQTEATTTVGSATGTTTSPAPVPMPETSLMPMAKPPMPMNRMISMRKDAKMVVQIGPEGNTLIRGTVTAVNASSLTITSWGGSWTINVTSDTRIMPKGTTTSLALISVGDFIGAEGKVDTTQAWTVNARMVRDADAEQRAATMRKQMQMQIKDMRQTTKQSIQDTRKAAEEQIKQLRMKMNNTRPRTGQ